MPRVRIVTDSTAQFRDPEFPLQHDITVVPLTIRFGSLRYREGLDLDSQGFLDKLASGAPHPVAEPPSAEEFAAVFRELARSTDQILSLHLSAKLSRTWRHAKAASDGLLGRNKIAVVDSLGASVGLGRMVEAAARAAEAGASIDEVVRVVRGMIPRLYAVFFTESLQYVEKTGRIGPAQAVLGSMLGIKPFLTLEEGDLVPMEKVRSRAQAVEKLSEFIAEFSHIEHLSILTLADRRSEEILQLLERLAVDFPGRAFEVVPYPPTLGTFIGPEGMGVMVLEGPGDAE